MVTDNTIVAFHIYGGGGNRKRLECLGEHPIGYFTDDLWFPMDENDNIIPGELKDDAGNSVGLTTEDIKTGLGTIDIDGDYNTIYTKLAKSIDPESPEAYAIMHSHDISAPHWWSYFTDGLDDYFKQQLLDYYDMDEFDVRMFP